MRACGGQPPETISQLFGNNQGLWGLTLATCVSPLNQARRFEHLGMSKEQADRLTLHVTEILCDNKERLASTYVSQTVLEKVGVLTLCCTLRQVAGLL